MYPNPYQRFRDQTLSLNDYLAIDRTVLANERTLLAYGRTALALAVVGASGLKLFTEMWIRLASMALIVLGVMIALRGWRRYRYTKRLLATALEHETGTPGHPLAGNAASHREKPDNEAQ
jgi:putative membrane protein